MVESKGILSEGISHWKGGLAMVATWIPAWKMALQQLEWTSGLWVRWGHGLLL
jgi:hypothetical protein